MRWAAHSARISVRRDAPDLLGVGLEEELVEALAEAVGDPLLEVVLGALAAAARGHGRRGRQRVSSIGPSFLMTSVPLQRIVEELAVPVDARHARAQQELLAHDLVPEVVDLLGLGEEAVAAEVEAIAVAAPRSWRCRRPGPRPRRRRPARPAWPAGSRRSGRRPAPKTRTGRSRVALAAGIGVIRVAAVAVLTTLGVPGGRVRESLAGAAEQRRAPF